MAKWVVRPIMVHSAERGYQVRSESKDCIGQASLDTTMSA